MFGFPQLFPPFSFGVGLHVFLFFIYLGLIVAWVRKTFQAIVFDIQEGNEVSKLLGSILQVFITVYCAVLVSFVQSVSISRTLLRRQSLTATHDITAAWSGVGPAVSSLYNQLSVATSVGGVSAVTAYLICVSILHLVTPSLFTLQLFNATSQLGITKTSAIPNSNSGWEWNFGYGDTAPLLPLLSRLQSNTPGLMGPTIFDVLQVSSGIGNATVNATTFNVTCGSVQGKLLPQSPNLANSLYDNSSLTFFADQTGEPLANFDWQVFGQNTLNSSPSLTAIYSNYTRQVVLISTYNFSDSQGAVESIFPLPSTLQLFAYDSLEEGQYYYNISSVQILGCTFSTMQHTAVVDVQDGNLVETLKPVNQLSEWTPFMLVNDSSMDLFQPYGWSLLFDGSPQRFIGVDFGFWCPLIEGAFSDICIGSDSVIDGILLDFLGLPPFSNLTPLPHVTLDMLEDAIANVTALALWFSLRYNNSGSVDFSSRQPNSSFLDSSQVNVTQLTQLFRLNLNILPLGSSSIIAFTLIVLSIILTSGPREVSPVDKLGFLQTLWLSHRNPQIKELMSKIDDPSSTELRRQGMTTTVKLSRPVDADSIEPAESIGLEQFPNDSEYE